MPAFLAKRTLVASLIALCATQALLFARMPPLRGARTVAQPTYYALDVGQGDATLVEFPGSVRVLIDAGVDQSVVQQAAQALGDTTYIDIGIITHPQKDHFYGFIPLLKRYRFGMILWNGRLDASDRKNWDFLVAELERQAIPLMRVGRGDTVRTSSMRADILSPGPEYIESGELNDTSVCLLFQTAAWRALITGDIDAVVEQDLVRRFGGQLRADILKAPHHGSKYGSSAGFLAAVRPSFVTISLGARNTYGHPALETLDRYEKIGAQVLRTDQDGPIRLSP